MTMGKKRSSIRTLPTGEKVRHDPSGEEFLVPENKAERFLAAIRPEIEERLVAQRQALQDAIDEKKAALDVGNVVPDDKRPI